MNKTDEHNPPSEVASLQTIPKKKPSKTSEQYAELILYVEF